MNDDESIVLSSTYRLTAIAFWESAKILHEGFNAKEESTVSNIRAIPFYYLLSHACELFLKSALLKRGMSESDLKKTHLRHDLINLLKELESKNVTISENAKSVLTMLSKQHARHDLRYTALLDDGNTVFTPPPPMIYNTLDELLMSTRLREE